MYIDTANNELKELSPQERILWGYENFRDGLVLSSSFSEYSAVMLDLVKQIIPDIKKIVPNIKILSCDTTYLTEETYEHRKNLMEYLGLDVHIVKPDLTLNDRNRIGDILRNNPCGGESLKDYEPKAKNGPFERGLKDLGATAWMSGVLHDETDERRDFSYLMEREDKLFKLHPILDWVTKDLSEYIEKNGLRVNKNYIDIFKPYGKECGLHDIEYHI